MSEVPTELTAAEPAPPADAAPAAAPAPAPGPGPEPFRRSRARLFWGSVFILIGAVLQLKAFGLLWWARADVLLPSALVVAGLLLLARGWRR